LRHPDYTRAWHSQGILQIDRGKAAEAEKSFLQVLELSSKKWMVPIRFEANINYLKALLMQNKLLQARTKVDALNEIVKNNYVIGYFDAVLLFKSREYDKARLRLQTVVNDVPKFMPAQLMMGATLFALKNYEQADGYLGRFITKFPTHIQGRKLLAATRIRQHRPIEALEMLSPLLKDDTKDEQLLAMVGNATISSGAIKKGTHFLK